ncbi:MAG TPA: hypothetical protein VHC44_11720 [Verrucomicrobiae bacterium]|nr:hypothetical protein [Verrucomicrobiae bacterium]
MLIVPLLLISCGHPWSWADYMAVHKNGIQKLEPSRQINTHYGEVDNFITDFGFGPQPLRWQTVAYIDGRFELAFVEPVMVDYSKKTVTPAGIPEFHLVAINHIIKGPGTPEEGGWGCDYDEKLQRTFGMPKWTNFVNSGFDLTNLGIPKEEIHSIPYWKEYTRAARNGVVLIK